MDLTMMYVIRDGLREVKKEMDEKGLSFEEFLQYYEEGLSIMEALDEKRRETNCRA